MSIYFYHWNSPVNESKHAALVGPRPARPLTATDWTTCIASARHGMDAAGGTS